MLLELLPAAENGLTLQQLSQELDLRPTTVHNLVRTLEARGYVTKLTKPTRYALGPSVIDLAQQYMGRELQRGAAKAVSAIFARFSNGRATYAECVGGEVVLKLRMTPERPGLLERPWNSVMLPYVSASVLVFQAFWTEQQRQAHQQRYPFADYGAHVWQTEERLEAFLADARAKGYADPPADQAGLVRVAVPIFFSGSEIVGALGAAMNVTPKNGNGEERRQMIEHVREEFVACLKAQAAELNHIRRLSTR
jgi:IclR family acetate operon transcriptional repressor